LQLVVINAALAKEGIANRSEEMGRLIELIGGIGFIAIMMVGVIQIAKFIFNKSTHKDESK
jgi:hypothetical protein